MKEFLNYKELKISFESCCIAENKRWFFLNEWNALCNMELDSTEIHFIGTVPGEDIFSKYLFADIKYDRGNLILIPRGASAIVIYNIKTDAFKRICIRDPKIKSANAYVEWLKFSGGILLDERIYLIPRTYPGIIKMDLNTCELIYCEKWVKDVDELIFENEAFFWSDYYEEDGIIYLAGCNADYLLKLNSKTMDYEIIILNNGKNGFSGIERFQEGLLLTGRKNGRPQYWKWGDVSLKCLEGLPENFSVDRIIGYSKLFKINSVIFAIPLWSNILLKIDEEKGQIEDMKNYDMERNGNTEIAVCCAWSENNMLYCHNNILKRIDIFKTEGYMDCIELNITEHFCRDMESHVVSLNRLLLQENAICQFDNFLDCLLRDEKNIICDEKGQAGKRIYETLF